ncbi:MAG: hypothetical protein AMXMBFR64_33180 [Myxococcales bacterium]
MPAPQYTPYYCEENIWHLAGDPRVGDGERVVAILSNAIGGVACFRQRASLELGDPVLWDYHVVLFHRWDGVAGPWEVWDLDTLLGAPVEATRWLDATFGPVGWLPRAFAPRFRLVAAAAYRDVLVSDRSHMRTARGWRHPPPPWPPIGAGEPTLGRLVDLDDPWVGEVVEREELERLTHRASLGARHGG